MLLNVLAVGDIVGEGGQDILARRLRELQEQTQDRRQRADLRSVPCRSRDAR